MPTFSDKYINLEIERIIILVEDYLNILDSYEYYSEHPKNFIKILKSFLNNHIKTYKVDIPDKPHFRIELLHFLKRYFIPILRYLQRAQTRHIPWSLVSNLEEIIKQLKIIDKELIIIIRPQWHWGYSIHVKQDLVSFLVKNMGDVSDKKTSLENNKNVYIISFPFVEKTNFLLHTMFGHEIGHFFYEEYEKVNFTDKWANEQINIITKKFSKELGELSEAIKHGKKVVDIYKGFVSETIPDIIGYKIFGPSMLFALYYLRYWINDVSVPEKKGNTYPPLKFRIRVLYELFKKDIEKIKSPNPKNELIDFGKEVGRYLKDTDDLQQFRIDSKIQEAYSMFLKQKNNIIKYASSKINSLTYNIDLNKIDFLMHRLENAIPPNEYKNKPTELGDIFLAGWVYYYKEIKYNRELNNVQNYIGHYEVLNKLLFSAANLSFVHRKYNRNGNS